MNARNKPGKHGTLYLYEITYRDAGGSPDFKSRVWRYSLEHVRDAFHDSEDPYWTLVSVQRVPERGIMARVPVHSFEVSR